MITNNDVANIFSLLSKLTDINGGDVFKSKSYSSAAFAIEKLPVQLCETPVSDFKNLKGIGASAAKKIEEILETGKLQLLEEMLFSTPEGLVEMLKIKGIGPKKINIIWKEMGLETIGELLYACRENRLKLFKGFGEKTQETIIESIEFYLKSKGNFLYAGVILITEEIKKLLEKLFPGKKVLVTGNFARQTEIITQCEFIIQTKPAAATEILKGQNVLEITEITDESLLCKTTAGLSVKIYCAEENFTEKLIETSSSESFYSAITSGYPYADAAKDEKEYFRRRNLPYIPAFLREDERILTRTEEFTDHLQPESIKGLIHCHSNWSDGNNTIEELAKAAAAKGMEYMAISDHSKTAAYAQGLSEERVKAQHAEIEMLNEKLFPFKIFKSIESDILNDGSLDYSDRILATFDLVIASVHSNLKMSIDKAMARLLAAIENPYTTILGHMTGRLLLSRPGYPLDVKKIIDACAANEVVIELNANPNRLDMDWRQIGYALDKNVTISINPDAHSINGIDDIRYGVFSAQKAMLTKEKNLSSFSLPQFEYFLDERKKRKGI